MADLATAVTVLDANGRAGVPSLLISGPGMGKSSLVRGLAAADGVLCKTVLGSLREPSDFAGLPVVREHGVDVGGSGVGEGVGCWGWRVSVSGRVDDESACCAGGDVGGGVGSDCR